MPCLLNVEKEKHSSKEFKHSLFQAFFQMQMLTSERWLNVSENLEVLQGIQNAKKDTDASEMYELLPQASLKEFSPLVTVDAIMPRFPFLLLTIIVKYSEEWRSKNSCICKVNRSNQISRRVHTVTYYTLINLCWKAKLTMNSTLISLVNNMNFLPACMYIN